MSSKFVDNSLIYPGNRRADEGNVTSAGRYW